MTLRYTILLSLLGHGILFMSWPSTVDFGVASLSNPYQVTVLESISEKKQIKKEVIKKTNPKIVKNNTAKEINNTPNKATPPKDNKAYVISRLNIEIQNNFKYPRLARRNGWQGKVILGLSVNSQGKIENAHIKTGSGHRILDQSALKALLSIKNIQKAENSFIMDYQEITIPVIYRLQKG